MRKLFLISAFVLVSAAAQAGQNRGLVLAANDGPASVQAVETAKPADPVPQIQIQTQARPAPVEAQPAQAQADEPKHQASKPVKKAHARHYEGDEAKARRIAARYGVYW
ncbi:hypothetical protein UP10_24380 [Bradyrhizobium sp. LTSPM299]|uniref:hypothetical protein n=1 Tax=Bradyrhizobium sp. LTSPM299 TaxID=1619233 RepID=UPI0005CA3FD0|nr:hypothetical protein [Bradyrhizobium sp. LTSPM299]KJC58128.1 hypothetical protein UP10_24380 [Bradyrhizobium sp. LTSPM299]